ncbi:FecR family protein [Treponema primitia]|uniref:hypothetical protein n=1 Tax=Treponema primitia TaxID=88058 RepID=UPI00397F8BDF
MAKKNRKNSRAMGPADYMVIFLCLAGAFFCLGLFWLDFNRTLSRQNMAPVGTISWKYKAAQRRFVDRVIWDRLHKESLIYNGDYVRTAELSEASVAFTGGLAINLAENSLIQIFSDHTIPRIDLTQGGISVDAAFAGSGTSLILNAGNRTISVAGGAVLDTRVDPEGNFSLHISEGSAAINTDGENQQLSAGEALIQDSGGSILESPQTVMLSPKPNARLIHSGDGPLRVEFSWNPQNYSDSDRTRIEIALDRGFRRIIRTLDGGHQKRVSVELPPGVFFWRAYPLNEAANAAAGTASGKLTILAIPVPRTLTPEEGREYQYRNKFPAVRFQWTSSPEISFHLLDVADNPGFVSPALRELVQGGSGNIMSITHTGLGKGRWYWRITPVFTDEYEGNLAPSALSSFTITQNGNLKAPVLLNPRSDTVLNIAGDRKDFYFSWQNEAEAGYYTLLISASADLNDPIITRRVMDNYTVYDAEETILGEGRYYWGVYQTDSNGAVSAISPSRSFTAIEETSILQPSPPPEKPPAPVPPPPPAAPTLPPPEKPPAAAATQPSTPPSTPPAVAAPAKPSSPPAAAVVSIPAPLLPEALGRQPENGYIIGPGQLRESRVITFVWEAVSGADAYIFTLHKEEAGSRRLIESRTSAQNSYTLRDLSLLENGSFIWQVEAVTQAAGDPAQRGTVGENSFTVDLPVMQRKTANNPGIIYGQ